MMFNIFFQIKENHFFIMRQRYKNKAKHYFVVTVFRRSSKTSYLLVGFFIEKEYHTFFAVHPLPTPTVAFNLLVLAPSCPF
jgi:hypothetical protein